MGPDLSGQGVHAGVAAITVVHLGQHSADNHDVAIGCHEGGKDFLPERLGEPVLIGLPVEHLREEVSDVEALEPDHPAFLLGKGGGGGGEPQR